MMLDVLESFLEMFHLFGVLCSIIVVLFYDSQTDEKGDLKKVRFFQPNTQNFKDVFIFVLIFHREFSEGQFLREKVILGNLKITRFWGIFEPKLDEIIGIIVSSKLNHQQWNQSSEKQFIAISSSNPIGLQELFQDHSKIFALLPYH
jgi:hypothetical protein